MCSEALSGPISAPGRRPKPEVAYVWSQPDDSRARTTAGTAGQAVHGSQGTLTVNSIKHHTPSCPGQYAHGDPNAHRDADGHCPCSLRLARTVWMRQTESLHTGVVATVQLDSA